MPADPPLTPDHDQPIPLILLPGMGADERLFEPQRPAFPELHVPRWIEPLEREPLASYAVRLAKAIDPGQPCFVGGVSFGGFVAVEMAHHLQTKACFLIGSARSPRELPPQVLALRAASHATDLFPWPGLMALAGWTANACASMGVHPTNSTHTILRQLAQSDPRFLRWATWAVLTWQQPESDGEAPFPICRIHGDADLILPVQHTHPDHVIPGAGHALSLTHAPQVNALLRQEMAQYASAQQIR